MGATASSVPLLAKTGVAQDKKTINRKTNTQKIQLRGSYDDPLGGDEIEDKKDELLKTADVSANSPVNMSEEFELVAYHCEIVDGVPRQWVGSVKRPSFRTLGGVYESMDKTLENDEKRIKQSADIYAENVSEDPRAAKILASDRSETTSSTIGTRSGHSYFSNWDEIFDDSKYAASGGNESYWQIDWKHDPNNWESQVVQLKTDMYPDRSGWLKERNQYCRQKFDFDTSYFDEIEEYNPGNTVGSISSTVTMSVGSGGTVQIGAEETTSSPEIEYNDRSYRIGGEVEHKTNIYNDLSKNTVVLRQIASLSGTEHDSGEYFMGPNQLSKAKFNSKYPGGGESLKLNYWLKWV